MIFKKYFKNLSLYLWILPAAIFIIFFLIKPSIETFVISLTEEIKISEEEIKNELLKIIIINNNENISKSVKIKSLHNWEEIIRLINKKHSIKIKPNTISDNMTVKKTVELIILKIYKKNGGKKTKFVFLNNYIKLFKDKKMLLAFRNNIIWLLTFTSITIIFGLLIAKLIDKISWAAAARSILFIPMAISYVASGVIWTFMYDKNMKIGTINAVFYSISKFGKILGFSEYEPIAFLGRSSTVNAALIIAGIWIWTGFCVVIFTAALKGIPNQIKEASKIDGANSFQMFIKIEIPIIFPTIIVVLTTMVINVLKIFDIVYAMTKGGPSGASEVIANRMYSTAFINGNLEYASSMAIILLLAIIPIMIINIKSFINEEINK